MVWIGVGTIVINDEWQRSAFSVGSTIIRVQHSLSPDRAALHRGVIALVDNQGGGSGVIGAQQSFPSTGTEVFVFPEIKTQLVYGLAYKEYKGPSRKSWNWIASVAYWQADTQTLEQKFQGFETRMDDLFQQITTLVNLLL